MSAPDRPATGAPVNGAAQAGEAPARERIAAVLAGLDPPSRELLDYSMRRRVSDEMLARLYQVSEAEIAQRRVAAVQRMTTALDARGATGLGRVLTALLEQETWDLAAAAASPGHAEGPEEAPAASANESASRWPVAGSGVRRALAALAIALAAGAGGAVVALLLGGDRPERPATAAGEPRGARFFTPRPGSLGNPFPTGPQAASGDPIAYVRRRTVLRRTPGGERIADLAAETAWGSPRVLSVADERDGWLAVRAPELPNGVVGWIPAAEAERGSVQISLRADLSERRLTVLRDGKAVRRFPVAVGQPSTPTPTGTFAVTDKLTVRDPNSPYGCCALALTGHQRKLPPGWPGGDRLAVHATRDIDSIGAAASYGCFRARPSDARWLIDRVPLGATIEISA